MDNWIEMPIGTVVQGGDCIVNKGMSPNRGSVWGVCNGWYPEYGSVGMKFSGTKRPDLGNDNDPRADERAKSPATLWRLVERPDPTNENVWNASKYMLQAKHFDKPYTKIPEDILKQIEILRGEHYKPAPHKAAVPNIRVPRSCPAFAKESPIP